MDVGRERVKWSRAVFGLQKLFGQVQWSWFTHSPWPQGEAWRLWLWKLPRATVQKGRLRDLTRCVTGSRLKCAILSWGRIWHRGVRNGMRMRSQIWSYHVKCEMHIAKSRSISFSVTERGGTVREEERARERESFGQWGLFSIVVFFQETVEAQMSLISLSPIDAASMLKTSLYEIPTFKCKSSNQHINEIVLWGNTFTWN